MPRIHPTAIVDPHARLAADVEIGPYSVVGPHVTIGPGTVVGSHCVIENHTTLGSANVVGHHVCLGSKPQDLKYRGEPATCSIGDRNDIRENVTVHIGTENGGGATTLGSDNLLMVGSHIAHDCHVRNHCIFANNVMLAGHVLVEDHAILSGGAAVSHYVSIGRYAFVGGLSGVVHDCPPFMMSDGHPNRVRGVNLIGLNRHGFTEQTVENLKQLYRSLYGKRAGGHGSDAQFLDDLAAQHESDPHLQEFLEFYRRTASAPNGRYAEVSRRDNKRLAASRH